MKTALFAVPPGTYDIVYAGEPRQLIDERVEVIGGPMEPADLPAFSRLSEAEILFLGWGSPRLEGALLDRLTSLRAVFYSAGSIKPVVSEAFWDRDIPICSAVAANAIPVAEFAHAAIMLSLKRVWRYERLAMRNRRWPAYLDAPGAYRSTVGLVGLGSIGRLVVEKLRASELSVLAYDPFVAPQQAEAMGVRLSGLEDLFDTADVVSLHAPLLPATHGMITGALIQRMKPNATLLNTSRGKLIREMEMIEVLRRRDDLTAVLDVVSPEPPSPDSPLFDLPNVVMTPHIAGSMGAECKRMGAYMAEELARFLDGLPLKYRITREQNQRMA
ncbi:MAG TPA: hydroxyacid dehydrogenase [Kiritimatiellia bacterium]|nr:hydroxyacid dehydrogenase [Kiritimatiellia bacterium]